ncbi:hypothetical protein CYY_004303 [Polysphondylium violaceum]|uniref:Ankyrin repeat-containing protein n=1 Tax=Polysphondylium violaceum TaxID=133409 RepID=A0A8J4PVE9_9MYCE|nr:hypothetical protein CYY_004303 [Polysphondylium violaceum]
MNRNSNSNNTRNRDHRNNQNNRNQNNRNNNNRNNRNIYRKRDSKSDGTLALHEQLFKRIWGSVILRKEILRHLVSNDRGLDHLRHWEAHKVPRDGLLNGNVLQLPKRYHDVSMSDTTWIANNHHFGLLVDRLMHPMYQPLTVDYQAIIQFLRCNTEYKLFIRLYNFNAELFQRVNGFLIPRSSRDEKSKRGGRGSRGRRGGHVGRDESKTLPTTTTKEKSKSIGDLACQSGSTQIVEFLVAKRYKITIEGVYNAVKSNSVDLVKLLLSFNHLRIPHHQPLMNDAVSNGNMDMIKLLVENGYVQCDSDHLKLLFKKKNCIQVLEYLVDHCKHLFVRNNQPLYSIAGRGHLQLFKRLYEIIDKSTIDFKLEGFIVSSGNLELSKYYYSSVFVGYSHITSKTMDMVVSRGDFKTYTNLKNKANPSKQGFLNALSNKQWQAVSFLSKIHLNSFIFDLNEKRFIFGSLLMNGQLELLKYFYKEIYLPERLDYCVKVYHILKAVENKHYDALTFYFKFFNYPPHFLYMLCQLEGKYEVIQLIFKTLRASKREVKLCSHRLIQGAMIGGNHNYIALIKRNPACTNTYCGYNYVQIAKTRSLMYAVQMSIGEIHLVPYGCRYSDSVYNFKLALQNKSIHMDINEFIRHFVSNNDVGMLYYIKRNCPNLLSKIDSFLCHRFTHGKTKITANPSTMALLLKDQNSLLYLHHLRINNLLVADDFAFKEIQDLVKRGVPRPYVTSWPVVRFIKKYKLIS